MTDQLDPKTGKPIIKNDGTGSGTDPNKNANTSSQTLDLSKVGDEDFDKIFDDPRLYKHPRFKGLSDRAKKADDLENAQNKADEERLKKEKKFEELAIKAGAERDEWRGKFTQAQVDNKIIAEAIKVGVVDTEAVLKLIDRTNIKIDDAGTATGITEAVNALLAAKAYLKGKAGVVTIGAGTAPGQGDQTTAKRFKLSQIQDPVFYRANEKDILQAVKLNLVEDDVNK
jgi:hypothetical protein